MVHITYIGDWLLVFSATGNDNVFHENVTDHLTKWIGLLCDENYALYNFMELKWV